MPKTLVTSLDKRRAIPSSEVADLLGLNIDTICQWARKGIIPGAFQPRGRRGGWLFDREQLEVWWKKQTKN